MVKKIKFIEMFDVMIKSTVFKLLTSHIEVTNIMLIGTSVWDQTTTMPNYWNPNQEYLMHEAYWVLHAFTEAH